MHFETVASEICMPGFKISLCVHAAPRITSGDSVTIERASPGPKKRAIIIISCNHHNQLDDKNGQITHDQESVLTMPLLASILFCGDLR